MITTSIGIMGNVTTTDLEPVKQNNIKDILHQNHTFVIESYNTTVPSQDTVHNSYDLSFMDVGCITELHNYVSSKTLRDVTFDLFNLAKHCFICCDEKYIMIDNVLYMSNYDKIKYFYVDKVVFSVYIFYENGNIYVINKNEYTYPKMVVKLVSNIKSLNDKCSFVTKSINESEFVVNLNGEIKIVKLEINRSKFAIGDIRSKQTEVSDVKILLTSVDLSYIGVVRDIEFPHKPYIVILADCQLSYYDELMDTLCLIDKNKIIKVDTDGQCIMFQCSKKHMYYKKSLWHNTENLYLRIPDIIDFKLLPYTNVAVICSYHKQTKYQVSLVNLENLCGVNRIVNAEHLRLYILGRTDDNSKMESILKNILDGKDDLFPENVYAIVASFI